MLAHSTQIADALADGYVDQSCELLEAIPADVAYPPLAEFSAALLPPGPAALNVHDTNTCPVQAGVLVAVELGDPRPLIDRAGVFN